MSTILLVSQNNSLPRQLVSWLEEFPFEVQVLVTNDLDQWIETNKPKLDEVKKNTASKTQTERPEPPSLVILDYPNSFENSGGWVNSLKKKFELNSLTTPGSPILVVLIVPDDDRLPPQSFVSSGADDLMLKPIDRTMLLQKLELLLARGKSAKSSFLYRMKLKGSVEIAKEGTIEEFSEVDCVLRNPRPIRPGTYATLHVDVFGAGENQHVLVRTVSSEPSAENQGQWRVRLRYFGLNPTQLQTLRVFLRKLAEAGLVEEKLKLAMMSRAAKIAARKALENAKPKKEQSLRVTVIDFDQEISTTLRDALTEKLSDLIIKELPSPAHYISELRRIGAQQSSPEVLGKNQTDLIIVDAALLIDDPATRAMNILEEYVKAGLASSVESTPPLIVIGNPETLKSASSLCVPGVSHFIWNTADYRHIVEAVMSFSPQEVWRDGVVLIRREKHNRKVFISHPQKLEELAEYGIVIRTGFPFLMGIFLKFYSEVFGREDGVIARCVRSKKMPDGEWESEFVFFGTSDDFQKRIRSSILLDHAKKRASAEGG